MILKSIFLAMLIWGCQSKPTDRQKRVPIELDISGTTETKSPRSDFLEISYIGNMGVLLESGQKTILIDGLHEEYGADYLFPPASLVDQLIKGTYEGFTNIEVGLATHHHGDHYSPDYARKFLLENPEAIWIGPDQVKEDLYETIGEDESDVKDRIEVVAYNGQIHTIDHKNISVDAVQCNHTYPARHKKIQNIAYWIDIDDYSILHVGDTGWDMAHETFEKFDLSNRDLDIAIFPYWMLLEERSKKLMDERVHPNKIIATHVPPSFTEKEKQALIDRFSEIEVFTELGQRIEYLK